MNVLQGHRIHTPSLFCSVTHHNLPVLFESCILNLLCCSEHRYTCCAQTPQIKRSTGSYMSCSVWITVRVQAVPVLDKNKAQICCSERTSGTDIVRIILFILILLLLWLNTGITIITVYRGKPTPYQRYPGVTCGVWWQENQVSHVRA